MAASQRPPLSICETLRRSAEKNSRISPKCDVQKPWHHSQAGRGLQIGAKGALTQDHLKSERVKVCFYLAILSCWLHVLKQGEGKIFKLLDFNI